MTEIYIEKTSKQIFEVEQICRNPNLGLTTKARVWKVTGQEEDPGVTSHAPGSAKSVRA
jgi:hypothetical protein